MVRRFEQWLREHGIEPAYDLKTGQFMVDKAQVEDAIRRAGGKGD
jgi:hypothetical protein